MAPLADLALISEGSATIFCAWIGIEKIPDQYAIAKYVLCPT